MGSATHIITCCPVGIAEAFFGDQIFETILVWVNVGGLCLEFGLWTCVMEINTAHILYFLEVKVTYRTWGPDIK